VNGRLLAIVMGIVILLGAAYATFTIRQEKLAHFQRAAALKDNLQSMRKAIAAFHEKEGHYPRSLDELIPNYIRRIPVDPVTHDPWRVTTEESVAPRNDFTTAAPAKTETYVIDVHSSATGLDANGKPFADY
jgi:general secretion pathway protein G